MKVFKFGGASVSTAERIRNVAGILKKYQGDPLLVVISAMGKTTNALEKVAEAFYNGNRQEALDLFQRIKNDHIGMLKELMGDAAEEQILVDFFTEVEWLLHDKPVRPFDYYYDQIVCVGELLSTCIVSHYLNNEGVENEWIDVRDIIRTDNNFRDARIDWAMTSEKVGQIILPIVETGKIVLTQGFIGATDDNESTTLGREGSDYTAAIFANLLNAEMQTIWKDVQGVMNADPKQYKEAVWISELNYREVIEMAYYGAQVIHPKTIKPLQNKGIPLCVRSFIHSEEQGTIIHNKHIAQLPPIIVYKQKQVLVQMTSRDFSFVGEGLSAGVYEQFEQLKYKPNLTQNAAISILCVLDEHHEKLEQFAFEASNSFDVSITKNLILLTIRHYTPDLVSKLVDEKRVVLRQQTPETLQVVMTEQ